VSQREWANAEDPRCFFDEETCFNRFLSIVGGERSLSIPYVQFSFGRTLDPRQRNKVIDIAQASLVEYVHVLIQHPSGHGYGINNLNGLQESHRKFRERLLKEFKSLTRSTRLLKALRQKKIRLIVIEIIHYKNSQTIKDFREEYLVPRSAR
jgi:hypothetical protein